MKSKLSILIVGLCVTSFIFLYNIFKEEKSEDNYYGSMKGYADMSKEEVFEDKIDKITIEYPWDVEIVSTKDKELRVYTKGEKIKVGYKIEDNHLKIRSSRKMFNRIKGNIKIEIPDNINIEELKISSINGRISVDKASKNLYVKGVNSDIDIKSSMDDIELETVNGDMKVNLAKVTNISCEAVNGDLILKGNIGDINCNVSSIRGSIYYNGNEYEDNFELGNGKTKVKFESVNGDIRIE